MPFFRERSGRRIRHEDLRMSNIFIDGGEVRIFDAVEFNPALAATDVAADVAYLAMDLRYCGKRGLAERFIDAYVECSGDQVSGSHVSTSYCLVRLLVEAFLLADPTIGPARKRKPGGFPRYLPSPTRPGNSKAGRWKRSKPELAMPRRESWWADDRQRPSSRAFTEGRLRNRPGARSGRGAPCAERDGALPVSGPSKPVAFERVGGQVPPRPDDGDEGSAVRPDLEGSDRA
jgi:hypothetical protein